MNRAYYETYLEDAQTNLGRAFDYAVNDYDMKLDDFLNIFINSGYAKQFEIGNPKYVAGTSGEELVLKCLEYSMNEYTIKEPSFRYGYSKEYWCGYILAYFQWYFNLSFKEIKESITMEELLRLYNPLHEASDLKAINSIKNYILNKKKDNKLKKLRLLNNYSQSELAKKANVSLRMIQQYEQNQKNINNANVSTLKSLAQCLNCNIEDLMEIDFNKK